MKVQIKHLKTDFTRFLEDDIRHTIRVVTETGSLECSGAILSQHSEVIQKIVEKEDEICLENYKFAKECLSILHGGSVEMNEENCEEIIKFGVQFGIADIVEQGLVFLHSNVKYQGTIVDAAQVCYRTSTFAKTCNCDLNIDFFWPLEETLHEFEWKETQDFLGDFTKTTSFTAVLSLLTNKVLAAKLLKTVTSLIDRSNIMEILEAFKKYNYPNVYVGAFSECPKQDVISFFQKIEVWGLLMGQWRNLKPLIKTISLSFQTREIIPREIIPRDIIPCDIITCDKIPTEKHLLSSWGQFTLDDIRHFCKVCLTSFYLVEVLLSWVTVKRPDLRTVRDLCRLLDVSRLDRSYLGHATDVFRTEGYVVTFNGSSSAESDPTANNKRCLSETTIMTKIYQSNIKNSRNKNNIAGRVISFRRCSKNCNLKDEEDINVEINPNALCANQRIFCEKGKVEMLYGRSLNGKQIPFYTDIVAAVRSELVYDVNTLRVVLESK